MEYSRKLTLAAVALVLAMASAASQVATAQNSAQDFLVAHNAARTAAGVASVTWDTTVAAYAQSHAETCSFQHSAAGGRTYGENIYWWSSGGGAATSAAGAVNWWVAEKQYYDYNSNSCTMNQECRHYTQVVWSKSTAIGCGRAICSNGFVFIVCNYSPAGNMPGERPY